MVFTVTIENLGSGDAGAFKPYTYLDNGANPTWSASMSGVTAGLTATQDFSWTAVEGTHDFLVVADGEDVISETDETNNEKAFAYDATILADLVVTETSWSPDLPSSGDTVTFTVRVDNRGVGDAPSFSVYVYLDNSATSTWNLSFSSLDPSQSITKTFEWTATSSAHTFRVVADSLDSVSESDETNNEGLAVYNATLLPDIIVDQITWTPAIPDISNPVAFTVTVKNQGQGAALPFKVEVFLNASSSPDWTLSYSKLKSGQTANRTFTWAEALVGSNIFKAVADGLGQLDEFDPANNEKTVTVPEP